MSGHAVYQTSPNTYNIYYSGAATSGGTYTGIGLAKIEIAKVNPPGDELVSWWKLDEGTGTAAKDAWGSNNGAVSGATWTHATPGIASPWAIDFDGVDDRITVPHSADLDFNTAMTIEAWIRFDDDSATSLRGILGKGEDRDNRAYNLYKINKGVGEVCFFVSSLSGRDGTNWTRIYNTDPISIGEWHHVVATFNAGAMDLFIDGEDVAATIETGGTGATSINTNLLDLVIADNLWSQESRWDGGLDDICLYNHALTLADAAQNYAAMSIPEPSSLVLAISAVLTFMLIFVFASLKGSKGTAKMPKR
ncbi:MAG: LamG domain-containing protein [Pirellulales bacterium]|nr:LamG domain-containing protein [Pirellulales bacterium]